jgi:hypothetical protein
MSNENTGLTVPPPYGSGKQDSSNLGGVLLEITADSLVDFSHTYLTNSMDPTVNCLFVIQVREKGAMNFKWADPNWTKEDHRVENMNKNLTDGKIIIIYAKEMLLNNSKGTEASMVFWNANQMKELSKATYAPDTERWAGKINKANTIQIIDGYVKIVDLS